MLATVDASMAQIVPFSGVVGAPPPPQNANIDHVPVPFPIMPDPRTALEVNNSNKWELDLESALAVAVGNSEVVRSISGATTPIAGSTLGGSGGGAGARGIARGGMNTTPGGPGTGGAAGGGVDFNPVGGRGVTGATSGGAGGGGGRYATIYDPAIAAAQVESALGAFDASFASSIFWERLENPPDQVFGGFITTQPRLDTSYFRSAITKPFVTGTVAQVSLDNNYYFIPPPGAAPAINPQYQTNLELAVLQPVLRGFGTGVNNSSILIAGAQANQSAWEFKRRMMGLVRSVETAYWQLYAAQINLQAIEEAMPLYAEVARIEESRLQANTAVPADVAQAQTDFLELRGQRLQAQADIAAKQALLRNLLGLPPTDGRVIVLKNQPSRARMVIDWNETINTALDRRPDVIRQRLAVHIREMQLLVARNGMLPSLNLEGLYRINGLGSDLNESFAMLDDSEFTDWRMGATFQVPLGNHVARGQMRASQLQLLREQALLKQTAHIASHQLSDIVRDIDWLYQQYEVANHRDEANRVWRRGAQARFVTPTANVSLLQALDIYLRSIRSSLTSTQNSVGLLAQYNISLVRLEEAKGTLLDSRGIYIYNDPCTAVQRTVLKSGAMEYLSGDELATPPATSHMPMPPSPVPMDPAQPMAPANGSGNTTPPGADGAHWSPTSPQTPSRSQAPQTATPAQPRSLAEPRVAKTPAAPVDMPQPPVVIGDSMAGPKPMQNPTQAAEASALREQLKMPSSGNTQIPATGTPRSVLRRDPKSEAKPAKPQPKAEPSLQPLADKSTVPNGSRLAVPMPTVISESQTMIVASERAVVEEAAPAIEPDLRVSLNNEVQALPLVQSTIRSTSVVQTPVTTRMSVGASEAESQFQVKGPATTSETITLRATPAEHLEPQPLRMVRQTDRPAARTSGATRPVWTTETVEAAPSMRR